MGCAICDFLASLMVATLFLWNAFFYSVKHVWAPNRLLGGPRTGPFFEKTWSHIWPSGIYIYIYNVCMRGARTWMVACSRVCVCVCVRDDCLCVCVMRVCVCVISVCVCVCVSVCVRANRGPQSPPFIRWKTLYVQDTHRASLLWWQWLGCIRAHAREAWTGWGHKI